MEITVANKNHNFLKLLFFVMGYVCLIGISILSVYGTDENTPEHVKALQGTVVELAAVLVLTGIYLCIGRKIFISAAEYKLSFSRKKIIAGIFLISPLIVFLYANVISFNFESIYGEIEKATWSDVIEDIMYFPLCAIIGPIFEELCCRVMCITFTSTKAGKTISFIFTTILFALCHGANFWIHIPGALIYGLVLLLTKNIMLTISLHIAWNSATFTVPVLSRTIGLIMPGKVYGIWESPLIAIIIFIFAFIVGACMILNGVIRKKQ